MATMSVQEARNWLIPQYPGEDWKNKILAMPDAQVIAVYYTMLKNRTISKTQKMRRPGYQQVDRADYSCEICGTPIASHLNECPECGNKKDEENI